MEKKSELSKLIKRSAKAAGIEIEYSDYFDSWMYVECLPDYICYDPSTDSEQAFELVVILKMQVDIAPEYVTATAFTKTDRFVQVQRPYSSGESKLKTARLAILELAAKLATKKSKDQR